MCASTHGRGSPGPCSLSSVAGVLGLGSGLVHGSVAGILAHGNTLVRECVVGGVSRCGLVRGSVAGILAHGSSLVRECVVGGVSRCGLGRGAPLLGMCPQVCLGTQVDTFLARSARLDRLYLCSSSVSSLFSFLHLPFRLV